MLKIIPTFLVKKTFDQVINNLQTDSWKWEQPLDFSSDDIIIKNGLSEKILGLARQ